MESRMIRRGAHLVARLHVDTGAGFSDAESFVIPATRLGNVKHIIRIPPEARRLRLSPMRGEGVVRVEFLRITQITRAEKVARMVESVIGDLIKFKNTNQARKYNVTWLRLLTDLDGAYADSAKLRFHSARMDYELYVKKFDTLRQSDVAEIRQHIATFAKKPLISVLMPVCGVSIGCLRPTVESVLGQIYENWELCVVVDEVRDPEAVSYFKSVLEKNGRVKVAFQDTRGHASIAANSALEMATGEFATIVGQSDVLSLHALYFVALKESEIGGLNIIYSDKDEIDWGGVRSNECFKSSWNPDLFFSHDLISHLAAYRTSVLRRIGGFRLEFEDAQDYDLALRCVKVSAASQICHIPRVLYHSRRGSGPGCVDPGPDNSIGRAGQRALSDYFKDRPGVSVSCGYLAGTYRVQYPLPIPAPMVSVIIPTRDGGPLLKKCIHSLLHGTSYENFEVIVVDNQSENLETVAYLRSLSTQDGVTVLKYDFPFNYSSINNFAVKYASGDILCFLNDDVEASEPGWLKEMVSHAWRPEIGAVGAKLLYADGFVQHAGVVMGIGGFAGHAHKLYPAAHPGYAGRAMLTQNFSAVTGACLVMRRDVFQAVGGFDEENLPVAFNDVDLCLRVREAGYRILWTPYAVLYHYESYSRGDDQMSPEKRARFDGEKAFMLSRWCTDQLNDPYYNVNLTLDREDFAISDSPRVCDPWRVRAK
ncbi:glycosyltransferase family 2 protein [Burkholderia multivorans]|nr:glycosyltransferase family 2 protein [Burkholderia multivorans]